MAAVLGIAEHNGWAEFVVVGAPQREPVALSRERVALADPALSSNPYHHEGLSWSLDEAQDLVHRVTEAAHRNIHAALAQVQSRHAAQGIELQAIALKESPFPKLPETLAEVLTSYTLTCAADGMLYREGLAEQAAALGLDVVRYARTADPIADAAAALGVSAPRMATLLGEMGRPLGTPWRKEHRLAAAAALCVLPRYTAVQL